MESRRNTNRQHNSQHTCVILVPPADTAMFGIGYDNMDQSQDHIGCDLLDIGSRRAATRGRCAHQSEGAQAVPTLKLGEPGAFDLPNVPDVSGTPLALVWRCNTSYQWIGCRFAVVRG